jgi:hypothetical protein
MINIGCAYHSSFQQIAWVDTENGEHGEQRLQHNEEAEKFYRAKGSQCAGPGPDARHSQH